MANGGSKIKMSTVIHKNKIRVIFKGLDLEGVRYVHFIESRGKIELLDLLGMNDVKKIFIDVFCDNTAQNSLKELREYEDHGELKIIDPEHGEVFFLEATLRSKLISYTRDETRGLIQVRFITMVRPKRL